MPVTGSSVVGIVHHIVTPSVFDNERPLCHTIVKRFPSAGLGTELLNSIACKGKVLIHFSCPYGVAIGKLYHIEIETPIIIAENHRVDAVLKPLILAHFFVGPCD